MTRKFTLTAASAAALLLSACESAPATTNAQVEAALASGDLAAAQARLGEVFAAGTADETTQSLKLDLMLKLGDGYAAMAAIDALPDSALNAADRRAASAHALILQGNPTAASDLFTDIAPETFGEQDFHMLLWALRDMGEDEDFDAGLEAGLEAYPKSADLNALAARALIDIGEAEAAQPFADTAFASDPEHFETRLAQGELAIRRKDLPAALEHYIAASKARVSDPLPTANVAGLQLDLGQTEAAGETLRAANAAKSEEPFLQWQLARYALLTDDLETARDALEKSRRAFRGNDEFTLFSAQAEERFGNRELALSEYKRYLRAVGEDEAIEAKLAELESGA